MADRYRLTRVEMVSVINRGGVVVFGRNLYRTADSLPTQGQIDAYYAALEAAEGEGDIRSDGSVPFTDDQSFGDNRATNVGDPVDDEDAANKAFVLTSLEGASSSFASVEKFGNS